MTRLGDGFGFGSKISRRAALRLAALAPAAAVVPAHSAFAQAKYPTKPIRLVAGFAAGGPSDTMVRMVGDRMGQILGQQIVVEYRTGAGGSLATEHVARSEPDGYTLLNTTTANASNETLLNLQYRYGTDLTAVASLAQTANVLVVHPSLGVKSVKELIALANQTAGGLLYASAGVGSSTHLSSELFNMMAGVKMNPVHYRGGADATKDLLGGQVKIMFSAIAPALPHIQGGRLLALGTTALKRDPTLPDIPTLDEVGVSGFEAHLWIGLTARAGTPREAIETLWSAANQSLKDPQVQGMMQKLGFSELATTPDEFGAFYKNEVAKWARVIKAAGIERR